MAYIQLSGADKSARAGQINTSIGTSGNMLFYSGTQPASPDYTATGTLLATCALSATAGVASQTVQTVTVVAGGSGGTNGAVTITGTTGTGTKFTATGTITSGVLQAGLTLVSGGVYSAPPTNIAVEPVTGGGLAGATVALVMTGQLVFNAIANATSGVVAGTAGYARIATSGGASVIDLDVGTSGTSVIVNSTAFAAGGPIVVSSAVLTEA